MGNASVSAKARPYYQGLLSTALAEGALDAHKPGSFIIRSSDRLNCLVLSLKTDKGIRHFPIAEHQPFIGGDYEYAANAAPCSLRPHAVAAPVAVVAPPPCARRRWLCCGNPSTFALPCRHGP